METYVLDENIDGSKLPTGLHDKQGLDCSSCVKKNLPGNDFCGKECLRGMSASDSRKSYFVAMNQLSIKPGDSVLKNESPTQVQSKISKSFEKVEIPGDSALKNESTARFQSKLSPKSSEKVEIPGDSVLKNESPIRFQSKLSPKPSEKVERILEIAASHHEIQAPKLQVPPLRPQMTWQNPPQIYQQPWVKIATPIRPLRIRPLDLRFGQQHSPHFVLPQAPQCLQQTQVI